MLKSCSSYWLSKLLLLMKWGAGLSKLATIGKWAVGGGWFWDSLSTPCLSLPFLGKKISQITTVEKTWLWYRYMVCLKMELVNFLMLLSIYIILQISLRYLCFSCATSPLFCFAVLCIWLHTQSLLSLPSLYFFHIYSTWDGLKFSRCCISLPVFEKKNDLFLETARLETNLLVTVEILTCPLNCTLTSTSENWFWWWCVSLFCNANSGRSHLSFLNIESVWCDTVLTYS